MTGKEIFEKLGAGRKGALPIPSDPEDRKVEILTLCETLVSLPDRSGSEGRSLRRRLRALGFRLSNPAHVAELKIWAESVE